jgi:dienelactone hydrolase
MMVFSSCTTLPSRETPLAAKTGPNLSEPPEESRFVKLEAGIPGAEVAYPVWRTRSPGKPVLFLHPINGLNPRLLHLALEMEKWGYRVYLPSLYGDPIMGESAYGFDKGISMIRFLKQDGRWNPVATDTMGPIVDEVASIARWVSRKEGGRRIAVIGNSLTGMMPLAILDEPSVRVAVLGQPATPALRMHDIAFRIPQSKEKREALSISEEKWESVVSAMRSDSRKRIFGFHYVEDPLASIDRFDSLNERLEEAGIRNRFRAYVLARSGDSYAEERSGWVKGGRTMERPRMLLPHSTYGAAENPEDEEWFRTQLRKSLGSVSF